MYVCRCSSLTFTEHGKLKSLQPLPTPMFIYLFFSFFLKIPFPQTSLQTDTHTHACAHIHTNGFRVLFFPNFHSLMSWLKNNSVHEFRPEKNAEWCNEIFTETPQGFWLWKTFDMKNKNTNSFFFFCQQSSCEVTIVTKSCTKCVECSLLRHKTQPLELN